MTVPYVGKSEYCYSNSLHMVLAAHPVKEWAVPSPGRLECLTTMPFGVFFLQRPRGSMFLFSPGANVNPDTGVDRALQALGWKCETFIGSSHTSPSQGLQLLRKAVPEGPALVGPMDLGGFVHNPRANYLRGGDHYVAVYAADRKGVSFHDPYGYPHAWLPPAAFAAAWKAGGKEYRRGPYTMRWNFRPVRLTTPEQAIQRTLPKILPAMTSDPRGPVAFGSLAALHLFLEQVKKGLPDDLRGFLTYFSIPLGSRRRSDAAQFAADARLPDLSEVFVEQAQLLGRAQLAAVQGQDRELVQLIEGFRNLEARAIQLLRREYNGRFESV
jgi:hypothetical protein